VLLLKHRLELRVLTAPTLQIFPAHQKCALKLDFLLRLGVHLPTWCAARTTFPYKLRHHFFSPPWVVHVHPVHPLATPMWLPHVNCITWSRTVKSSNQPAYDYTIQRDTSRLVHPMNNNTIISLHSCSASASTIRTLRLETSSRTSWYFITWLNSGLYLSDFHWGVRVSTGYNWPSDYSGHGGCQIGKRCVVVHKYTGL